MLEIWWVRHGTTDWNTEKRWQGHTDMPLNDNGRRLAMLLAERLKDIPFDECWSSDLRRSAETAQLALPERQIRLDARLREIPMGHLEGKTWNEISPDLQQQVADWWKDPYTLPFPGGAESLADVTARVKAWQSERPKEGRIIVFTHGGVIRCCLWDMLGMPTAEHNWTTELGNTGIVRIRYSDECMVLVGFNDLSHIPNSWDLPPAQNLPKG
ncbi:histidine phosphatase family protein [bacterium]|nr:histidine phosphatase family protein [bacterium]